MKRWQLALIRLHSAVYAATGGRLLGRFGEISMLLLTTTGRKSGQRRTLPLAYYRDGDTLVLIASNGGSDRAPAWLANLESNPEVGVQLGSETRRMRARVAGADERARLWPAVKQWNPAYARYEQFTSREIPLVLLRSA